MLTDHFTSTISISRSTTVARKKTFAPVFTDVPAHIQALQDTLTDGSMNRKFQDFLMFTETAVEIGDKITDQDGKRYEVIGVANQNFRVGFRHYESTLKAS